MSQPSTAGDRRRQLRRSANWSYPELTFESRLMCFGSGYEAETPAVPFTLMRSLAEQYFTAVLREEVSRRHVRPKYLRGA